MHLQMDDPAGLIEHMQECGYVHCSQLFGSECQDFQGVWLFAQVGLL